MNTGQPDEEGPVTKVNLGRLTNCIFAFTLLYLFKNIQIPTIFDSESPGFLQQYLSLIFPEILNFLNAFLLVAIIWILTFHNIHLLKKVNHGFLYLHFGMLMPLVFIPVSSMLADDFPEETFFSLLMHLNILMITIFLLSEWGYICRNPDLAHNGLRVSDFDRTCRGIIFLTAAACIGIILSYYDYRGTRFLYLIVLVVLFTDSVIYENHQVKVQKVGRLGKGKPKNLEILFADESKTVNPGEINRVKPFQGPIGMDMLEILMNGVFGFTMTLIVKNIPLPTVDTIQDFELFGRFYIRVFFDAIEFVTVFIILAIIWILTFQILRWMKNTDLTFIYLEFFELLFIVFIPVTSTLLTFFGDDTHVSTIYGLNITMCGIILLIQWHYLAARRDLQIQDSIMPKTNPNTLVARIKTLLFVKNTDTGSFYGLHRRLLILPSASILWLVLSLSGSGFEIIPVILGFILLVYYS